MKYITFEHLSGDHEDSPPPPSPKINIISPRHLAHVYRSGLNQRQMDLKTRVLQIMYVIPSPGWTMRTDDSLSINIFRVFLIIYLVYFY